jgi:8-oxo-dGTP diphosphatase
VSDRIRAAGGVVWRGDGRPRIALIHRDRYDDWTLPKGKVKVGEHDVCGAVREVREETGATVAVGRRLVEIDYVVGSGGDVATVRPSASDGAAGVPKTVRFWAMRYVSGDFTANVEVDELAWVPLDRARHRLSYDSDRRVLDAFEAEPVPRAVIVLVRHAKAGKRSQWGGEDRLRPLDETGRRQARRLATFLSAFAPARVVSADRVRCVQTVEPFAKAAGVDVEITETFADEGFVADPERARAELIEVAKSVPAAVICSQGTAVPGLVADLAGFDSVSARKGSAWVLCFADDAVPSADYYGDAAR